MVDDQAPSRKQVEWTIAGILRRIAHGAVHPRVGLRELIATYQALPEPDDARFVGEEYGIAQLIGYFYSYDDIEERPTEVSFDGRHGIQAATAVDAEVVRLARA